MIGETLMAETFFIGSMVVRDKQAALLFVHGLTGKRTKTWLADGAARPWPQELLASGLVLPSGYGSGSFGRVYKVLRLPDGKVLASKAC